MRRSILVLDLRKLALTSAGENTEAARRILIVEDEEAVRGVLRRALPSQRYDVEEAVDGEQALALIERGTPDLVVLDWKLPGIHGSLVLDELKRRYPELPVIVITGDSGENSRGFAEALRVDAFLTKPFSPSEMLETIERLLGERPT